MEAQSQETFIATGSFEDEMSVGGSQRQQLAMALGSVGKMVAEAGGSPFLIVETLLGLQEEDRIRVVDGRAGLIDGGLPRRVHEKMRQRLSRLSDEASDAATVAACFASDGVQ